MKLTWFATASIALEEDDARLLFDPFLTLNGAENRTTKEEFAPFEQVFVTHGHLDHLYSIPELAREREMRIFCTATPRETLLRKGVEEEKIVCIKPGDRLSFGELSLTVFQGRHVRFDGKLIRHTVFNRRITRYRRNLPLIVRGMKRYPENGEIVGYLVEWKGKSVFVMGSLGLDQRTDYPSPDVVVLPYQGRSDLAEVAGQILARLRPKAIVFDHFDDAFPPVSDHVDPTPFCEELRTLAPSVKLVIPTAGVPVDLDELLEGAHPAETAIA
ncbi:MAG: MBL fold metallo-hydrolase [Christensenellaceae bacterium]